MSSVLQVLKDQQRDVFVEQLMQSAFGTFQVFSIYLGGRLGLYQALAKNGPLNAPELAARAAIHPRYAREWLEQQAITGILEVEDEAASDAGRAYRLPEGHREVLLDADSLHYLFPLVQMLVAVTRPLDALCAAYRSGGGVPFSDYGPDLVQGQAAMNRPMFLHQLAQEWLARIPKLKARLQADPPARVADVGCGAGWSSIAIARAFSKVAVDGFDLDPNSIESAQANLQGSGLADRVAFHLRDAAEPGLSGSYDLVMAFECIHDLSDPVAALRAMRRLAAQDGVVLVADERVAERFSVHTGAFEWMMYGWSLFHCLPVGMASQPSAQTGAVMRAGVLESYAHEAGFSRVEILPIDHFFFRFYRLHVGAAQGGRQRVSQ